MRFRSKMMLFGLVCLTIISLVLIASRLQATHLVRTTGQAYQEGLQLSLVMDEMRQAQVSFQRQVQEWKNTMLRGHDLTLQRKYWTGFEAREAEMQQGLQRLQQQLNTLKMPETAAQAQQLIQDHRLLGQKYRAAMQPYLGQPMTHTIIKDIDEAVRGIDRATSAGMDDLVVAMQQQVRQQFDQQAILVKSQANRQQAIVFAVTLGMTLLLLIGLVWVMRGLLQALGADPEDAVAATARIAKGDLTESLQATSPHSLIGALEMMQLRLRNIYLAIDAAADNLKSKAHQLPKYQEQMPLTDELDKLDVAINRIKIKRSEGV
ncbi:MAG: hypothetical protein VXW65_04845 [Pseudomonadota bacterium]|nr:hypothetical protein [Pseudomonadota bacterium]